jgi:arylsulfatase A
MMASCFALASEAWAAPPKTSPNVLIVLADDLGYGDLGCYGHPVLRTPELDQFAAEGLKLTSCYAAAANCSPSRAGLMTGRTPFRLGIYNWIPRYSPMHLRRSEVTMATLLRNSGYDTCHVGKWHLNGNFNLPRQPQPVDHGFDYWFSTQNNALPNHRNPVNFVRNGEAVGLLNGYSAELVAGEATRWLKHQRDRTKPFFLFVCFHEPHEPIATDRSFSTLYPSNDPSLSAHHGNISQMDAAFGSIVSTLDRLNLRQHTFIFFTSDNGPAITAIHPHGSAGPLRDKKGYLYEGGIRVPGLVQWPGHVEPGSVSDEPVSGVDLLPTVCEIAGISPPADRVLDGTSICELFRGQSIERTRPLYWQFNQSRGPMKVALRDGRWKLLAQLSGPALPPGGSITDEQMTAIKKAELTEFELFDLQADVAEQHAVREKHQDVFLRLRNQMVQIYHEVRDAGPVWPAWDFARYEAQHIEWPDYWLQRQKRQ